MAEHKSEVCVGGPHDGQRVRVNSEGRFTVTVPRGVSAVEAWAEPPVQNSVSVGFVAYTRQAIASGEHSVSFWAPEGQPELESVERLLARYPQ